MRGVVGRGTGGGVLVGLALEAAALAAWPPQADAATREPAVAGVPAA